MSIPKARGQLRRYWEFSRESPTQNKILHAPNFYLIQPLAKAGRKVKRQGKAEEIYMALLPNLQGR